MQEMTIIYNNGLIGCKTDVCLCCAKTDAYVVREGDCLWSIAEEQLGDGMYWSGIYEANRELIEDDPNLLYVGWTPEIDADTVNTDSPSTYADRQKCSQ